MAEVGHSARLGVPGLRNESKTKVLMPVFDPISAGGHSDPSNPTTEPLGQSSSQPDRESSSSPDSRRSHASRATPPVGSTPLPRASPSGAGMMYRNGMPTSSPPLGFHGMPKMMGNEEALANLFKSNPLLSFNPALLSLNPSLYAVQLAQLQAAQLLSQSVGLHKSNPDLAASIAEEEFNMRKRKLAMQDEEAEMGAGVLNLSKRSPLGSPKMRAESPLDLSGNGGGGRRPSDLMSPAKAPKLDIPPWATGAFPFLNPFLAVSSSGMVMSPGGVGPMGLPPTSSAMSSPPPSSSVTSSENRNPLERMSEIAKGSANNAKGGPRQSAWQSQWISRGPEANKDIFRCVWCKDSFPSLQSLTTHMKETKHFGASIPPSPTSPHQVSVRPPASMMMTSPTTAISSHLSSPMAPVVKTTHMMASTPPSASSTSGAANNSSVSKQQYRDILKEQLPLPRKLVRGQDVWLGRGEQQTKDILKCMWCGESFRSLDLMTKHMQETKHYTKVISQEQLVSWKSADSQTSSQNHVNAVLTCKVCDQAYSTLKELSDHMVKNNHYKESQGPPTPSPGMISPGSNPTNGTNMRGGGRGSVGMPSGALLGNGSPPHPGMGPGGSSAKEKRKKSLPVRKLLELERAQQEMSGQFKMGNEDTPGKISCEKCGEKILMHIFVDHIRQCVGPLHIPRSSPSMERLHRQTPSTSPPVSTPDPKAPSPVSHKSSSDHQPLGPVKEENKSILGSLEKMVQSNFGTKTKAGPDSNMSILQRLGIDEGVDYSKPLVDPMAMFRPPSSSAMASVAAAAAAASASFGLLPLLRSGGGSEISKTALSSSNNSACSSPDPIKPAGAETTTTGTSIKSVESPAKSPASDDAKSPVSRTELLDLEEQDQRREGQEEGPVEDGGEEKEAGTRAQEDGRQEGPEAKTDGHVRRSELKTRAAENSADSRQEDERDNRRAFLVSGHGSQREINEDEKDEAGGSQTVKKAKRNNREESDEDESPFSSREDEGKVRRARGREEEAREADTRRYKDEMVTHRRSPLSPHSVTGGGYSHQVSASSPRHHHHQVSVTSKTALEDMAEDEDIKDTSPDTSKDEDQLANEQGRSKKKKSHPLAALQLLCDKTEKTPHTPVTSTTMYGVPTDPGAILAFSWACNQAVVNDSLLKCPFCDTPFISKGAYRHHLSKMHFVKDGSAPDHKMFMAKAGGGPGSAGPGNPHDKGGSPGGQNQGVEGQMKEENAQSKFQKYSQLAKQLSCSTQP
eukprot:maker-scaffold284_size223161-snap-gene-1.26 protein:Tk12316 transcript:maker-scaffold284_size223161-snap-gene-1.26-mRNA-1 annotation:"tiptop "